MQERRSHRRWWRIAGAIVVCALVYVLVKPLFSERISGSAFRYARAAQETATAFDILPLPEADARDAAFRRLVAAEARFRGEEASPALINATAQDPSWAGALRACIEYLAVCGRGSADEYASWARSQGKSLPAALPIWAGLSERDYAERYRRVTGRSMPAEMRAEGYFRDYFEAYWKRGHGELRPDSIAVDARAVEVAEQRFTHWGDFVTAHERTEGLGAFFWTGGIAASGMLFWWPEHLVDSSGALRLGAADGAPVLVHDVQRLWWGRFIETYGGVDAARVLLVYKSAAGIFVPTTFYLVYEPENRLWQITGMGLGNVGSDVRIGSQPLAPPVY